MYLITSQSRADGATDRWKDQYQTYNGTDAAEKQQIGAVLAALGAHPRAEDVDAAIGNSTWTELHCQECHKACNQVIEVGDTQHTVELCETCIRDATILVTGTTR